MTYTDKQRQAYLYFFNELRLCIEFPDCFIPKLKSLMSKRYHQRKKLVLER